jgi:alpha-L-rhamnosidase
MKKSSVALVALVTFLTPAAALTPVDLRCEYAVNPLGVDSPQPRLFWKLQGERRGQRQTAYEILAASSRGNLAANRGDLWDSGKVDSDETIQIPYAGKELESWQPVFWKVRVWDEKGHASGWSQPATWTMGVLEAGDWHAPWISTPDANSPSTLLRREFVVKPGLKRALVNICGLGQYELTLNSKKVGDQFLSPGWTKYNKTCLYDTLDVTENLRRGKNAVGIELGNGMYHIPADPSRFAKFHGSFGPQKAIAQIRLEYADGSVEFVGTDGNWKTSAGPITFSSIYGGEDFDARLVQLGWNQPGFDDSRWQPAEIVNGPGGELRGLSCAAPPIKFFETHKPVARRSLPNGDVVYDLGQNAAHVPRITVTGPTGSRVRIIPSELTNADGSANQSSMGGGRRGSIWCDFTKATDGAETWSPKFFYVGCRYLQVDLTPATPNGPLPRIKSIAGIVIHSASKPVGRCECSNDLFNRIFSLVHWAQQNNMVSILTDCPHRERLGWLEQDHLNGPALRYDFGLAQLFTKIVNDIAGSQLTNGLVPTTAPEYVVFRNKNDPEHLRNNYGDSLEWSSSFILIPWQQYEFDGDLNLFRRHWDAMKHYVAYIGSRAPHDIVDFGLGDWYDLGPRAPGLAQLTPVALTATAFYFEDAKIPARAAKLLGKTDDANYCSALAEEIRAAFNEKFYDATHHDYATGSQTANAVPLVFGICEPTNRAAVVDAIVRDVRAKGVTAGDVGYRYVLRALADNGRSDVVFEMNDQTNRPGYGMQVAKGKTSLTEAWDGTHSQDHFMLGQIQEWFYHDLAGIQNAPGSAGFKQIVIKPQPVGDLKWVCASYDSIRGEIVSDWKRDGGKFTLAVTIPPNTTAAVFVPAESAGAVTESGKPAAQSPGVKFLRMEKQFAVFEIGSGNYKFETAHLR